MPAHRKKSVEEVAEGYLATVGASSKTLRSKKLAEAWCAVQTAPRYRHCRIIFNGEDRRPFIVSSPSVTAEGKATRLRKKLSTFPQAKRYAEERDIAAENHGRDFASELSRDEVAAVTAWRKEAARLRENGVDVPSLADTLRQSLAQLTASPDGRTLDDRLIDEFLEHKADHGIGAHQHKSYRNKLARFLEEFEGRLAASITAKEIEQWLAALKSRRTGGRLSPQSRKNHRAVLHALFSWLLAERNPVAKIRAPRVSEPERDHYRPEEISRLLHCIHADDRALLPAVALAVFCGLRTAEIERLDLADVPLDQPGEDGEFILRAALAKTGRTRAVPLPAAAKAWLAAQPLRSGPAMLSKHHRRLATALEAAEVRSIPNGFRHSFATYRGAIIRDAGRLADEMGNSAAVIARHYRSPKLEAEARTYFDLRPGQPAAEPIPIRAGA